MHGARKGGGGYTGGSHAAAELSDMLLVMWQIPGGSSCPPLDYYLHTMSYPL